MPIQTHYNNEEVRDIDLIRDFETRGKIKQKKSSWLRDLETLSSAIKSSHTQWQEDTDRLAAYDIAQENEEIALLLYRYNKLKPYQAAHLAVKHFSLADKMLQNKEEVSLLYDAACRYEAIALKLYDQPRLFNSYTPYQKQCIALEHESLAEKMLQKNDINALSLAVQRYPRIAERFYTDYWQLNLRTLPMAIKSPDTQWQDAEQLAVYIIAQENEEIALLLYRYNKLKRDQAAHLAVKHFSLANEMLENKEEFTLLRDAAHQHESIALKLYDQFSCFTLHQKQLLALKYESLAEKMLQKNDISALSLAAQHYPKIAKELYTHHFEKFYLCAGESDTMPLNILSALSFTSANDLFSISKEPSEVPAIELNQKALSYFTAIHAIKNSESKFTDDEQRAIILTNILENNKLRQTLYPAARILALSWLKNYSANHDTFEISEQLKMLLDKAPQLPLESGSERGQLLFWFGALCNVGSANYAGRFYHVFQTALGEISNRQELFSCDANNPIPTKEEQIQAKELARAILDDPRFINGIRFQGNSYTFAVLSNDQCNKLVNKYPDLKREHEQREQQKLKQQLEQQRLEQQRLEQQRLEEQRPVSDTQSIPPQLPVAITRFYSNRTNSPLHFKPKEDNNTSLPNQASTLGLNKP